MLERATFVTTTGTGPLPPPRPLPPPPAPCVLGAVLGSPTCHTAYPVTPTIITRKSTQRRPRFFGREGRGGSGASWSGLRSAGRVSYALVVVGIATLITSPSTIGVM